MKLAEGGFNRTFLITMHGGFEMVARIPYPITVPKFHAIASEVATMRFLRSSGLPVPEIYDYSPSLDNAADTEYIFERYEAQRRVAGAGGTRYRFGLGSTWRRWEGGRASRSTTNAFASVQMPGCICGTEGGRSLTWIGNHVPHSLLLNFLELIKTIDAEAALVAAARKELAYLEQFDRSLLPFQRERREGYGYKEQSPSDHIKNLERYLLIASSLVSKNSALHHFRIRYPDLQPNNVIVSTSSDSNQLKIVSLPSTGNTPRSYPRFSLLVYQVAFIPPSLPANMDELDQSEQSHATALYHRRLVHFHYIKNTEEYNELHHDALSGPASMFICRLFDQAGAPWEGETHALKTTLIDATEIWGRLTGEDVPCPVVFEPEGLLKTKELSAKLQVADENSEGCRGMSGFETETWVSNEHYAMAMALAELLKLRVLTEIPEEEVQAKTEANWFLNDMDEKDYM